MVERKTLRNVLDEVLSSTDKDDVPGLEGLSALIHRQIPPGGKEKFSIFDESPAPAQQPEEEPQADLRRKAALYLSEETLDDLVLARSKLAAMLNDKLGQKPSSSDIVDQALQIVLDEFSQKGMRSSLVRKILTIRKSSG